MENILGPLWVYAVYREVPPLYTIAGGVMLIVVLAGHEIAGALTKPPVDAEADEEANDKTAALLDKQQKDDPIC